MSASADPDARRDALALGLAAALAAAAAALLPPLYLDGDSCTYASLARDIATGAAPWSAPQWARDGSWTWFREHPPGGVWPAALLGRAGLAAERASAVANALATAAAAAGVAALVRRFRGGLAPLAAACVFLLHVPVLRCAGRAALEPAFAAAVAWTLASALRLREARAHVAWTALALAAAFLVRGAGALVVLVPLAVVCADPELRPPLGRVLAALALAALPLVLLDRAHAAVTGDGFWGAYLRAQVLPSFEGGSQHARAERQFGYFSARLVTYALPWLLLPAAALVRARGRPQHVAAWRLLGAGVLAAWLGAAVTLRPASRYLFAAWPCLAALAGLALPVRAPRWSGRALRVGVVVCAAVPTLVAGSATGDRAWRAAARALRTLAAEGRAPAVVRGTFDPEDARDKAFLRWHLGVRTLPDDDTDAAAWRLVRPPHAPPADARIAAVTPFGTLVVR